MERRKEKHIGSLLNEFLSSNKLQQGYAEYKITKAWGILLGKTISKATKELYVRDKKLFVKLHSSVMRNELTMIKDDLIIRLNEEAGADVINDIIFR